MEELNNLLNEALQTKNQDYVSPNCMVNCFKAFEKLSRKDKAASKVLIYFFPENFSLEKNDKEFWFIKYKNDLYYNEIALLKIYYNVLSNIRSSRISYPSKGK